MLISIIIPMYKVASVLPDCLSCLEAQTYPNVEILFVDDCSPDESSQLVEAKRSSLEQKGYLVKLLRHEVNQGVAAARNMGINHATGDYVYAFDADDLLEPDTLEALASRAKETDADIVGFDWFLCEENTRRYMAQPRVTSGVEALSMMCKGVMKWNLWLFLVKRSLLERSPKLRFLPRQNMGEDMMLMGKAFLRAEKVSIVERGLYHYTKTNTGSLTANYTEAHWAQVDSNLKELAQFVSRYGDQKQQQEVAFLKLNLKLPLLISPRLADYRRWASWFPEANKYIMQNDSLPMRTKVLQLCAKYRLWSLVWLYYQIVMRVMYRIIHK